ncbi:MAG TPA: GNAT family N-acetyltransferase [Azospirillaceae bacterium]|nr:GNAT family N-acetyltransferase [Azospirillaceae bacterium]HRQ80239.1 GNAT family N-acetyltransferase [Azospirillaceae bacterium]
MIYRLSALSCAERAESLTALERIFFASSLRQRFADDAARAAFFATWTGWYVREAPHDVLLWRDGDAGSWAGYLTGCRDSAGASELFEKIPLYDRFADLFERFPAHLHVNVDEAFRGRRIGAALVDAFAADCRTGLHVVTGAAARNRSFYRRCGFAFEVERGGLLFMGRD